MGELLRYVVAHEVGHTLGFQHNMKASSAYPVDSSAARRSCGGWGHTPTLMDYSRFNYVAQPEDKIPVERSDSEDRSVRHVGDEVGLRADRDARRRPDDGAADAGPWAREQDTKPWLRFSTSGRSARIRAR